MRMRTIFPAQMSRYSTANENMLHVFTTKRIFEQTAVRKYFVFFKITTVPKFVVNADTQNIKPYIR